MTHEVYIGRVGGQVVYVGEGRVGRHKHLNSGVSNVYQANQQHFLGRTIETEVILIDEKEKADALETELIEQYSPPWNVDKTAGPKHRKKLRKLFKDCPLTKDVLEQHYIVGILYLAKDILCSDRTMLVSVVSHKDIIKQKTLIHLARGHFKWEGVTVDLTDTRGVYSIRFSDEFFSDKKILGRARGKIQ